LTFLKNFDIIYIENEERISAHDKTARIFGILELFNA